MPNQASTYLASFQAHRQNLKASRVIQVLDAAHEASSFFSESGYPTFLDGKDAGDLERLFTLEDLDQAAYLFAIIHRLLSLGQNQMKHTTTQSLAAINSFSQDPTNQMSLRPLRALQNPTNDSAHASPSQQMPEADPDDDLDYDLDSDEEDEALPQAPQLPNESLDEQLVQKG
ncbi:hypothetical protein KXW11_007877, partial [Aspergillus fumigatus]